MIFLGGYKTIFDKNIKIELLNVLLNVLRLRNYTSDFIVFIMGILIIKERVKKLERITKK